MNTTQYIIIGIIIVIVGAMSYNTYGMQSTIVILIFLVLAIVLGPKILDLLGLGRKKYLTTEEIKQFIIKRHNGSTSAYKIYDKGTFINSAYDSAGVLYHSFIFDTVPARMNGVCVIWNTQLNDVVYTFWIPSEAAKYEPFKYFPPCADNYSSLSTMMKSKPGSALPQPDVDVSKSEMNGK